MRLYWSFLIYEVYVLLIEFWLYESLLAYLQNYLFSSFFPMW